jgi:hypothetical protein
MATKARTTKPSTTTYDPAALAGVAQQYRNASGGTGSPQATAYAQATRALAAWARSTGNAPTVHALVHLGWHSGTGSRSTVKASNSAAWRHAAPLLAVGKPSAPQVCTVLGSLAAAGAPPAALATVWATYTGQA